MAEVGDIMVSGITGLISLCRFASIKEYAVLPVDLYITIIATSYVAMYHYIRLQS